MMVLRLAILAWLGCLAIAGPVAWDASKCAQKCNGGTKFQYSEQTSYVYKFESSNLLKADGATDLNMGMTATFKVTAVSKCEMVLQVLDVSLKHGTTQETASPFIDELKRNPLPFSWNDGKIEHVCPNPDDSNDVNNIKKAMISALQNSMRTFEANLHDREVDVLGSCNTEYILKENKNEKFVFTKNKDIATCTDHLKGQTLLLATFYESSAHRQHLPLLSGETLTCQQTIENGIIEEVVCDEKAAFKPLYSYGYVVEAEAKITVKKISAEGASAINYRAPKKESLVFKHNPESKKNDNLEVEAQNVLKQICDNSEGLINKNAAHAVHKLVYLIRGLNEGALERIYQSLKSKQLCRSRKALTIYLDALKAASSGGSIALFSKLVENGEVRKTDAFLWMTLLPFTSYVEEESVAATLPLLRKDTARRQALLGVSAMAYKYCTTRSNCEDSNAVKSVSSSLKQFLGDKCQTTNKEEETQIITALKAFGNLGYVGESAESIFECAALTSNQLPIRIAAIQAFRRTPCTESIAAKLLETYKDKNEEDEVRIAALISLSKCATEEIIRQVLESYNSETSKQVEVFTWSLLENLKSSSHPVRERLGEYLWLEDIKVPDSTDLTKFSRNFDVSFFSEIFNLGHDIEANIIHSKNSFLPRSADLDFKSNIFGNQLDLLQVGGRVEDLEHTLEKLFGPRGLMPNLEINDVLNLIPENLRKRGRRSAESYKSKLESLGERLGYSRGKTPHGSAYIRVLGHELGWVNLHKDVISKRFEDFNIEELVREIVRTKEIDVAKNLLYLDVSILFPSVTGRAYKLAGNASLTLGLKTNGKIELHKNSKILPLSGILLEGIAQPSILLDSSASFTIHSENYEPGVRAETTLSAGLDINGKFEFKDFKLLHIKLSRRQERQELLSLKRTLYSINQNGVREIPKPQSYNLNYCTKYVQYILGARYCVSATIPHIYNDQGKPKIPFVRAMEASVVVEQVDKSMDGYELFLQLPDFSVREERKYKFLLDTPNSEVDRKLSADLTAKRPDAETTIIALKTYSPFYSLDVNVDVNNRADAFRLKADALGNQKRRYSLLMDVGKDVRGARLVEYQPKISLILPNVRPIELSGTIVFSKGRKALVSINMQSNSFDSPLNIKGNLAQEGDIDLEEDWKVSSELNITAFSQIHRLQSSLGNLGGKGLYLDLGHHYEPDGRSYESVTVNAKLENVELRDRLQFSLDAKVLLAEHQDLNSHFRWDFSVKPLGHFKNDVLFRYGENFEDNKHLVRLTQKVALHGDFDTFQHMDLENKLGLTISCFDFDKSAALSVVWDFEKRPKLFVEVGVKSSPDREISLKYDYRHVSNKPLKLVADGKLVFYDHKVLYRDHVEEVARNEYRGQAVLTPREGKDITINYVYKIKSQTHFHHELDGTVSFPATQTPVKIKADLEITSDSLKLNSIADSGSRAYSIDMNLQKTGASRVALNTPYIEGNVNVDSQNGDHSVRADIKTVGKDDRRIVITGNIAQNDITTLTLDIQWDADKDSEKKLSIKAKTNKATENGIDKHMITAQISYEGSINVDVTGKISTDLLRGPHYFRADFSGNMESMAIEYTHEIKNGEVESVAKYLRSNVEKLKLNMKGKYVLTGTKFQIEYGLFLTSPYKTFDGKELYFQIMADSTETARTFIAEYRIKPATVIGYVGKIDYIRKRGWPGQITSNLLVTVHQRPVYEGNTLIEYGNGKYSWKTSFTPISKKKINLLTHFEHSAKFAAFHHSMASTLEYLQKVELNAVADLRNTEDAKVYSNLDVNHHKMYDANATMKIRSMVDFEGQLVILSKITPSFHLFYRTQPSGQLTKYDMNLDVDSVNLIAGSGEIKKRKKGVNADMVFKYKEKEFLNLNINQEIKSKSERNYVIKVKTPWRSYTSYIKVAKEKKGKEIKYETKFCRNEKDQCISIDVTHKELADGDEWQIAYERGDVAFSIERIRISTNELSRFHTVIYNGDVRYGYDLRFAKEENGHSVSLGIILPSREIVTKTYGEISLRKPRVKFEFQTDARKHPERKLITDIRFENHLADNSPSKLDVIISHPTYEKPIELQLIADFEPTLNKFFTAQVSADYSNNPEDKLIGKLSMESSKDGKSGTVLVDIYHKDEQNLDFTIKANTTMDSNEDYGGVFYYWKDEDGADVQAFTVFHYIEKERRFYFEFNRPKFVYRLDGAVVTPPTLLGETCETDLTSVYQGETTKAKLIADYKKQCYKLIVYTEEGETSRIIEVCVNSRSRKILSIVTESLDDEGQWTFDFSLDIVRKSWRTIKIMSHYSPEFLGQFLFKATAFGDELTTAGVRFLPMYDSPRFKKIRNSFHSKIFQPTLRFFIPEAAKFIADLRRDTTFAVVKLRNYYNSLPPFTEIKQTIQRARQLVRSALYEVWSAVESYYKEYFKTAINFVNKATGIVKAVCHNNEDCKAFVNAFNDGGWKGLANQIKIFIQSIPQKIRNFMERPGVDARKFYDKAMILVKAALQPLTKYKCGEIVVKIVQLTYTAVEPHIQSFLENYPRYYRTIRQAIVTNKYVIQATKIAQDAFSRLRSEVEKIDFEKLISIGKHYIEDFLFNFTPPSPKSATTINAFDVERGHVDFDIHFGVSQSYPVKVLTRILDRVTNLVERLVFHREQFSSQALLVKFKRGADLNFFPPYEAQAMLVGNHHFVTFDKVFYDFAGECTYLLSRDFEDGNFTFALKPSAGEKGPSILALINDKSIEVNSGDQIISVDDNAVELPYLTKEFTVSRSGSTVIIDDKHGVKVKCNLVYQICTFSITGWYFGKTAGLLGTYNYEPSDEFKRPKGQVANSPSVLAKSFELKKGCKSNNLVPEVKIKENSDYYKLCKEHFESTSSPLSACFYEVKPEEYFQLCLRHLARASDPAKSLCNIAAAYVMECERNYIELNLPSKCITCSAPDGSTLQQGDRKKYENLSKKSADVVFIVEDHECNKAIVNDLGNLARSIERELQNDGFKDVMFGAVGYGADIGNPQIYTVKGSTFFNSRDINSIKDRIKAENQKTESSRAFEAMKLAVNYLFRSDTAKSFVLLSCSPCKYDYKSLLYPVIHQILLERGISLHVVKDAEISIRKSSIKEKDIIGVDPVTVYHSKDVTQRDLVGEPALRSQISLPKDLCIALSQDVDGSFFSSHSLNKASSGDLKNWRSVFARKFLKSTQSFQCQMCDCTSTRDHIPNTICQPCEAKRPRLPFSVCKSCALERTAESFLSYLLQFY
ncbi:apolipophorins-like isoform X1 [Argiope bruennichi]|uniref:apolipophorins-like isoform X1 n=1 Tax=Argiope bruennichi TaxID=94029 RepID=UPI002495143B|nr:apolipophorins-like isoform X1 [Argiope bruennichi]